MNIERAVELDLGFRPEAAVSGALCFQSERTTILTFNAVRRAESGRYEDAGRAVIEFLGCLVTSFGLPNDEALPGHPLFGHGLDYYGCFEVLDSRWRTEAEAQNRVQFPQADYGDVRHFAFTFHDSSFECLANDITAHLVGHADFRSECDSIVERLYRE